MAIHSSILAWRIAGTEEPDGLESLVSQRVRNNLETKQQQPVLDNMILNLQFGISS